MLTDIIGFEFTAAVIFKVRYIWILISGLGFLTFLFGWRVFKGLYLKK